MRSFFHSYIPITKMQHTNVNNSPVLVLEADPSFLRDVQADGVAADEHYQISMKVNMSCSAVMLDHRQNLGVCGFY